MFGASLARGVLPCARAASDESESAPLSLPTYVDAATAFIGTLAKPMYAARDVLTFERAGGLRIALGHAIPRAATRVRFTQRVERRELGLLQRPLGRARGAL